MTATSPRPPIQPALVVPVKPPRKKRKEMTQDLRKNVVIKLLRISDNGDLPYGVISHVAKQMRLSRCSVTKLWKQACVNFEKGLSLSPAVKSQQSMRRGNIIKYIPEMCSAELAALPLHKRTTIRDAASALKISKTTLHRLMTDHPEYFRSHNSRLKPTLTEENKLSRLFYVREKEGDDSLFHDLYNEIHVDEKWFFLTSDHRRYILAADEADPYRSTRHKGHIEKIMFLSAVARPRWVNNVLFDGKIGIWPIGEYRDAQRNSRNRDRGTPVWHNLSLDRNMYRNMLVNYVLPAIKEKFPENGTVQIKLQQDNAPAHVKPDDPEVLAKINELQLNLEVVNQPPNSPDLNINDLGFFRAIQSIQEKNPSRNATQLIGAVTVAYNQYSYKKLNNNFLTLQCNFNSIIKQDGGNNYKILHMSKDKLEKSGQLPASIYVMDDSPFWDEINDEINDEAEDANEDQGNKND